MLVPLNLEEHKELGDEIRVASRRLRELAAVVVSVYGPQNEAAFRFQRVVEELQRLQRDMQAQAALDLPGHLVDGLYL